SALKKDKFVNFFEEETGKGVSVGNLFNIFERFFVRDSSERCILHNYQEEKHGKNVRIITFNKYW
ncbi:hypothetical protein LJC44_05940, partial [Parabacteroides sp. OttesenSCG-928-G06]|nr:hypothetical protein [Parabacteroides sp. OttesenSCG-928-G06]